MSVNSELREAKWGEGEGVLDPEGAPDTITFKLPYIPANSQNRTGKKRTPKGYRWAKSSGRAAVPQMSH